MLYTQFQIPIPWLHILISPAVWAIIIAHFCDNWGFSTLLTCMPTYFKQAIHSLQIGGRTDVRIIQSCIRHNILSKYSLTSQSMTLLRKESRLVLQ